MTTPQEQIKALHEELIIKKSRVIPEHTMKGYLKSYSIPVPKGFLATTVEQAIDYAKQLSFPLVLKLVSDKVLHKTELNGVKVGINDEESLRRSFQTMHSNFVQQNVEGYQGILIEEQTPAGIEIIVGIQMDEVFGPVLMVGMGGIFTDVFKDVAFKSLPLSYEGIHRMLSQLKSYPLLQGYRGQPPVNMDALVKTIHAISLFAEEWQGIYESMDFNPVIVDAQNCRIVDAKLVVLDQYKKMVSEAPRIAYMENFFKPESVAVIGASATSGKIGNVILDSLINLEYKGSVFPINPNYDEIMGIKSYPSLKSLPLVPDLVVVVVDLKQMPEIIKEMAAIRAHNALIVSGGGKELGGERASLEKTIYDLARKHSVRIIGPNCIGSFDGYKRFDSFFYHRDRLRRPKGGPMSFITQSGTWGCAFLESSQITGVNKMVSYGNRVDVDEGDLIAYLAIDPDTKVIGSYLEGLSDGNKFNRAVQMSIENNKPVVVFKTGRNPKSAEASVSHTGAYGGSYEIYKGVMEQKGVILTDSFHECFASCEALTLQPYAKGNNAAMLSNGAGPMVNALDLFPEKGLNLVKLSNDKVAAMRDHFSFFYIVENPVDVTGSATAADYEFVINQLMEDDNVDIIMPFFVFQNTPLDESLIQRMDKINKQRKKPIVCCASGGPYTIKMSNALKEIGIPIFPDIIQWVSAAASLVKWGQILKKA